nr:MAG: hypothetical protein [uncultured archaeon]
MNGELEEARRELIEVEGEYFIRKTKVTYLLIVERLQEIQLKAQELAKDHYIDEMDELYSKLLVLR